MHVIAKAYGDEPLHRIVTGERGDLIYLVNPDRQGRSNPEEFEGVGFPRWSVFRFDSEAFEALIAAWESGDGERLKTEWEKVTT